MIHQATPVQIFQFIHGTLICFHEWHYIEWHNFSRLHHSADSAGIEIVPSQLIDHERKENFGRELPGVSNMNLFPNSAFPTAHEKTFHLHLD